MWGFFPPCTGLMFTDDVSDDWKCVTITSLLLCLAVLATKIKAGSRICDKLVTAVQPDTKLSSQELQLLHESQLHHQVSQMRAKHGCHSEI